MMEEVISHIKSVRENRCGRMTFTIERGWGQTYRTGDWTIYAHDSFPRHSVMSGRGRRTYIHGFGPNDEDKQQAVECCKAAGVWKYTKVYDDGGSSHVDVNQIVGHLPDEPDVA